MSSRNRKSIIAVFAAVLLAVTTLAADGLKKGDALPALETMGLEGTLPALKGKVVWLDFWASWCGPCAASFPAMDRIYAKYKNHGLVVLGVNVDDDAKKMEKFLEKHPVSFPIVRDAQTKLVARVSVETMPTSLLVDRTGRIVALHSGFKGKETEAAVEKEIEALLGAAKP